MIKVFRFLVMCTISVVFASIASAQTYKQVDYPGAIATTLNGGPNPQGTSVGGYTDTSGVIHGFTLTNGGVFTSFDPPGSTLTITQLHQVRRELSWAHTWIRRLPSPSATVSF